MVAERMQRQQVLYQPDKQVQIIMLEGALRSRVVSAQTLAGQLDRLMSVIAWRRSNSDYPLEAAVPIWPTAGFRLYDDLVIEESVEGENQVADSELVARYGKDFELLREAANVGRDAVAVIRRSFDSLGADMDDAACGCRLPGRANQRPATERTG